MHRLGVHWEYLQILVICTAGILAVSQYTEAEITCRILMKLYPHILGASWVECATVGGLSVCIVTS